MNEPLKTEAPAPNDALEPSDEQARPLREETTRLNLPVQESSVRFEEAMDYIFQKNSELCGET